MNHLLNETYNLDSIIQELQTTLYETLTAKWDSNKLDAYGRVYKNERDGQIIPEVYNSSKGDYTEVLFNNQSCFFFVDDDKHVLDDEDHEFTTDVKIVFMLNLKDLKTSTERVDADVKRDVLKVLRDNDYQFIVTEYIKGIDNVLSEFNKIKFHDIHPMHVFAFKTGFSYSVI